MEVVIKTAELPKIFHVYVYQCFFLVKWGKGLQFPRDRSPWAIYQRVTASMKSIKTQSELNPSYLTKGSVGEEL